MPIAFMCKIAKMKNAKILKIAKLIWHQNNQWVLLTQQQTLAYYWYVALGIVYSMAGILNAWKLAIHTFTDITETPCDVFRDLLPRKSL